MKTDKIISKFGKTFLIQGKKGSGKSSYLAWIAMKYIKKGITVYSNFYIEGCRKYTIEDLGIYDMSEAVVIYDEGGMDLNSRNWNDRQKQLAKNGKKLADNLYMFNVLSRHCKSDVYYATQFINRIDNTIREILDEVYVAKKSILNIFGIIRIDKSQCKISINEDTKQWQEEYSWRSILTGGIQLCNVNKARKLYNSWEMTALQEKEWLIWGTDLDYMGRIK
jgi:hypothetical protein